jgi:hypothetical protein
MVQLESITFDKYSEYNIDQTDEYRKIKRDNKKIKGIKGCKRYLRIYCLDQGSFLDNYRKVFRDSKNFIKYLDKLVPGQVKIIKRITIKYVKELIGLVDGDDDKIETS